MLYSLTEIMSTWAAIEVVIGQIIVAMFEIPPFTKFMIGTNCDYMNKIIVELAEKYHIFDLHGYDTCFDIKTSLSSGSLILLASSGLFFISIFILKHNQKLLLKRV